ncbi:MAG: tRNA (guanosine(37)-N1)-methyltransferase TrmD [Lachnospiraceae bacterium]|nr:tRNA (guanosine(37)-N1)-methyltransferase TrmD [Lachnospiraceae bacterium]
MPSAQIQTHSNEIAYTKNREDIDEITRTKGSTDANETRHSKNSDDIDEITCTKNHIITDEITDSNHHGLRTVYVTPQGRPFTQEMARLYAQCDDLVILCGHYEGVDERVLEEIGAERVSIGDYVLTGGELPAMVIVDAVARLVPGVLSNEESAQTESFDDGLLEYPQYTRPEVWRERRVPGILLSGDHAKVDAWRHEQALMRTKEMRPDLYEAYIAGDETIRTHDG